MAEIRIATDYLRGEERKAVLLNGEFMRYSAINSCNLSSAPTVSKAFNEFSNRWDERRGDLSKGLTALADALSTIRQTFEELDTRLAQELDA